MKQRYVLLFIITWLFTLKGTGSFAQSWRWGARGGSASSPSGDWETVKDMATDRNGNIYVLSNVYQAGLNVTGGGNSVTGNGRQDILITSYRCDGSFRWKKLIGGPDDDYPLALQVDSSGGVYAAFSMILINTNAQTGHIDSDTSITGPTNRSLYLVKYDTSGTYQWLKRPQPDTISTAQGLSYTGTIDLNVDGTGNVYWLCHLPPGAYEHGAFVINNRGVYIIKYNAQGVYQGLINMDMYRSVGAAGIRNLKMQRDHGSGRFYISGTYFNGLFILGNDTINKPMFVAAFDNTGGLIWKRSNTLNSVGTGFYYRPVIDDSSNIYLGGRSQRIDTFNGYIVSQIGGNNGAASRPFIVKMDSNGNNLWALDAIPTAATYGMGGVALRNKNEVVFAGSYPGDIRWPGYPDTLVHGVSGGVYFTFITRFNAHTGQVLGMERLPYTNVSGSSGTQPSATVADGRNNVYIGGELAGHITVNGNNLLKTGGNTDWYLVKYGHDNCSCTSGPGSSLFAKNYLNDSTIQFTASGYAPDDTLYWNFGDNSDTALLTTAHHTYTDTGTFNVCLKLTNGCGDSTFCDTVRISNPCVLAANKPRADLSFTIDSALQKIHLYYTGSKAYDSLLFDLGDGTKIHADSQEHTYARPGSYVVCVTTYNACGSHTKCDTVNIPLSISRVTASGTLRIYPNPANDILHVGGLEPGSKIELYDILGRKKHMIVTAGKNEVVNMNYLPPGNYIMHVTATNGQRIITKVVKR